MPGAVSNSSTLIHLSALGLLSLLRDFYNEVAIPPAVWREVVEEGRGRPGVGQVEEAAQAGWLKVLAPGNEPLIRVLNSTLDSGEAQAIALALECQPAVLLVDESEARQVAETLGIPKTGVVGLLLRARFQGRIGSLREHLDRLRFTAGFWISDGLFRQVIEAAGEPLD